MLKALLGLTLTFSLLIPTTAFRNVAHQPGPSPSSSPDNSHGQKHFLFIRAVFPDHPSDANPSNEELNGNSSLTNRNLQKYSYGTFSITWDLGPSITLPHTTAYYAGLPGPGVSVLID